MAEEAGALVRMASAFAHRRASHRLSTVFSATLTPSSTGSRFGLQVRPFNIRSSGGSEPGAPLAGSFTIYEVGTVDPSGAASKAGLQVGDVLLDVGGTSVRSADTKQLSAALASASAEQPWLIMRVKHGEPEPERASAQPRFQVGEKVRRRDGTEAWGIGFVTQLSPLKVNTSDTDPSEDGCAWDEVRPLEERASEGDVAARMATTLRAYQERAATLVQNRWRSRKGREAMSRHLCAPTTLRSPWPAPGRQRAQRLNGARHATRGRRAPEPEPEQAAARRKQRRRRGPESEAAAERLRQRAARASELQRLVGQAESRRQEEGTPPPRSLSPRGNGAVSGLALSPSPTAREVRFLNSFPLR